MDNRAAKLALARKKLKDHQDKKQVTVQKVELLERNEVKNQIEDNSFYNEQGDNEITVIEYQSDQNVKAKKDDGQILDAPPTNSNKPFEMNVTEMLISSKRSLESQVTELQLKLADIEAKFNREVSSHNDSKQRINHLEIELHNMDGKYSYVTQQMLQQNNHIEELNNANSTLLDKNNNLLEQLEFTKTVLVAKETENASLHSQLDQLSRELEVSKLQLQQLLNGSNGFAHSDPESNRNEELLQKIENLEQQLKMAEKEKNQINMHYEHYVAELNEQLKLMISKNEELSKQIYHLSNRETSLIDQIGDMEIRIQNLKMKSMENTGKVYDKSDDILDMKALQNENELLQQKLQAVSQKYELLHKQYEENEAKVKELQDTINSTRDQDSISISKLTADITSDKIAAQRATQQNQTLKIKVQELEEAFVKISQDKLDLTEKVTAEKFLNRELTIKLAECEDKCKDLHTKLKAKDDEMIRLQNNYRELEKEYEEFNKSKTLIETTEGCSHENSLNNNANVSKSIDETTTLIANENNHVHDHELSCRLLKETEKTDIQKEDAMIKLQERFLKIMSEVADLSDEKHRLEHIILQLQNETDTICEYVALYQQQRSLLKKRDDERNAQIKLFQTECDRLKRELEELSGILIRFAEDKDLATYFQVEARKNDIEKVRSLLFNLKNNSLVDIHRRDLELTKVYPCNCCSGNLIEV